MYKTAKIIPCYNEEKRIRKDEIAALVNLTSTDIYFCNDGSNDNTLAVLHTLEQDFPGRCFVYHYEKNTGKANTVFVSVNKLLEEGKCGLLPMGEYKVGILLINPNTHKQSCLETAKLYRYNNKQ